MIRIILSNSYVNQQYKMKNNFKKNKYAHTI